MLYCPRCGNKVDESFDFCPYCGFPLGEVKALLRKYGGVKREQESPVVERRVEGREEERAAHVERPVTPRKIEVEVRGLDRDLRTFFSGKVLRYGPLTLEQALSVFYHMPREYPKKVWKDVEKGRTAPVSIVLNKEDGTLFITLLKGGSYVLDGGVRELESVYRISENASFQEAEALIRRFYQDPNLVEEWKRQIQGIEARLEEQRRSWGVLAYARMYGTSDFDVSHYICVTRSGILESRYVELGRVPPQQALVSVFPFGSVQEIEVKRGALSAGMTIKYYDEKGKLRKAKYDFDKDGYDEILRKLLEVAPQKVRY